MTNVKFKAGDKVYFPAVSSSVLILKESDAGGPSCPFEVMGYTFTVGGKHSPDNFAPALFHASEGNHKKLEALTGLQFEKPREVPTNADIIQAMFARGDKFIMCYVSDYHEVPDHCCSRRVIDGYDPDSYFPFTVKDEAGWKYATPIDSRGNRITEL